MAGGATPLSAPCLGIPSLRFLSCSLPQAHEALSGSPSATGGIWPQWHFHWHPALEVVPGLGSGCRQQHQELPLLPAGVFWETWPIV